MKALIVDDEPLSGKYLESLIKKYCFEIHSIELVSSPIEAVKIINERFFDIIFLDIEMPELNGFEVLNRVQLDRNTELIFTTAYSEHAVKAFEVSATDYLMKVIKASDLIEAIRKVQDKKSLETYIRYKETISIYFEDEYYVIDLKDIIRLEASKSYTKFYLRDGEAQSTKGLSYYELRLAETDLIRCHKSHIVNMDCIKQLNNDKKAELILKDETIIPVSTTYLENIKNQLKS